MTSHGSEPPELTPDAARNRVARDAFSDEYQAKHAASLATTGGLAWGTSRVPESALRVLGDVAARTSWSSAAARPNGPSEWLVPAPTPVVREGR